MSAHLLPETRPRRGLGDADADRAFFGHPRGLSTLFFSEMWERFSYYGMRGFLILYMTAAASAGGMGMDTATAAAIYGTYTSMVYLMSLPGGWIADRLIGQRKAVLVRRHSDRRRPLLAGRSRVDDVLSRARAGRAGHRAAQTEHQRHRRPALRGSRTSAATPASRSSTWGSTWARSSGRSSPATSRRDEGFRARLTGWGMDPNSAWHWGFGAAGVGMTLGLIQYVLGGRRARHGRSRTGEARDTGRRTETAMAGHGVARRWDGPARRARRRHRDRHASRDARTSDGRVRLHPAWRHGRLLRLALLRRRLDGRSSGGGCT